ncbi:LysR family transcriptional regulator [Gordonia sp. CPCC 205515]|uniref:LysR family transcriptional regulator n=1 Tax=Gordonia sp. CPCC 205515 TaxID=3140791 RepID=UPI003AF40880
MNVNEVELLFASGLAQLVALDAEQSLTSAADRSGVSQPTLSRTVRTWEHALGVALVERDGRALRLTAAGIALSAAAREALDTFSAAVRTATDPGATEILRIGCLRSLNSTVAGELLGSFIAEHPEVRVAHREGASDELLAAVDDQTIEVAVTAPRPARRFSWIPLGRQRFVLLVHSSHPLATRASVSLTECADEPALALDTRFHTRRIADTLWRQAGVSPRVVLEADNLATLAGFVGSGLGVSVVPADGAPHPRTVAIPIDDATAEREFGIVWDGGRESTRLSAFLDHARQISRDYPNWADIDG